MKLYLKIGLGTILLVLIFFVMQILVSTGYFRNTDIQFNGEILRTIELPGTEDIEVDQEEAFAIISSTDRTSFPSIEEGDLYYIDLSDTNSEAINLTQNLSFFFSPHGISMRKMDSTYLILAINHRPDSHTIEKFMLKGTELIHLITYADSSMISPNDVVLVDDNEFYFSNDHKYTKGIGRLAEDYLGLAVSNVVHYKEKVYNSVADGIAYANGINIDFQRSLLFLASPRHFLIKVFNIERDGSLSFIEDIDCKTGVDNIDIDNQGMLWVGCHPNLLAFTSYALGKADRSPSEVIKIEYQDKGDYRVEPVFLDDGSTMTSSSVAVPYHDQLLCGNVLDDKMVILRIAAE